MSLRSCSLVLVCCLSTAAFVVDAQGPPGPVDVQILAINDLHGNLAPPTGSSGRIDTVDAAGGVEYLATHIEDLRALNPNTVVVSAGDNIGNSPLLSAAFHDEPTIEALNLIGLDFTAIGDRELDEGLAELVRMQQGGCHPVDGCFDADGFAGAQFRFLSANVKRANNKTVFPAYKTRSFNGVSIAFIGVTLQSTPSGLPSQFTAGLSFGDEADAVNALVPELKRRGVEAIVVLLHDGSPKLSASTINQCGVLEPFIELVNRLDDEVDVVVSGHTHQGYNCVIDGKVVTSAASFGRVVTKIDLELDPVTRDVVSVMADNRIVTRDVPKAPLLTALVEDYTVRVAPLANRVIGTITADITSFATSAGESALGDVIADAWLEATENAGGAVAAFITPGSIRANLNYASPGKRDGDVTFGELFLVLPFDRRLVTMTVIGAQIKQLLEQQFVGCGQPVNRILQVSEGFSYSWSPSRPACDKVSSIMINSVPVDFAQTYRITVDSFLADGGDSFVVMRDGTNPLIGAVDVDALAAYISSHSPVAPGPRDRILGGLP